MTDFLSSQLDALHQINLDIGKIAGPLRAAATRLGLSTGDAPPDIPTGQEFSEQEAARLCDAAITRAQLARDLALRIKDFLEDLPKEAIFPKPEEQDQ